MENKGTNLDNKADELEFNPLTDKIFDKEKPRLFPKHDENHKALDNVEKKSRLNPDSEIITKKDPDEVIMLPNEELKKMNNRKNKNQPF